MKCNELTKAIQEQLGKLGYYRGHIDGVIGPLTNTSIVSFKRDNGLRPRDYVGPITLQKMFDKDVQPRPKPQPNGKDPAWIMEAKSLYGVKEFAGSANNPIIMGWAADLDQWYTGDSMAWCGLFVANCMALAAPNDPQDFNRLGARQWLKYGEESVGYYGDIAVFTRRGANSAYGHVAFVMGEYGEYYWILGGNQNDAVGYMLISKSRLLGFRRPVTITSPKNPIPVLTDKPVNRPDGKLS